MKRKEAEELLKGRRDGTFLIRDSQTQRGSFACSVVWVTIFAGFTYYCWGGIKRGFSSITQCERGCKALHDLQDVGWVWLCWALQPALLAQRSGPPLPPHISDPAQPAAECNPGLARSQPAAQLRNTSTPPSWRSSQSLSASARAPLTDPGDTNTFFRGSESQHWVRRYRKHKHRHKIF